ncbi:MAG TPA: hypothetical protein VFH94_12985 [Streptomyces sp.]|nr:hypothetical protein [Streptomyces sp.]
MANNNDSVVEKITHAKVEAVALRVVKEFQLAADKVAAHHGSPAKFPMPSGKAAAEHLLMSRFGQLSVAQQKSAAERVTADLNSGVARSNRLGDLAKVDLRSPTPVEAQVKSLPFPAKLKFPSDELRKLPPGSVVAEDADAAASALPELGKLEFRIHRVKCLDSTSEIGKDEIYLGGTCVDESGDTKKVSQFKVRSFHTGNEQVYSPPRQFTFFNLREGTNYPKSYFVTLVLAEVDWGGFAEFLNDLLDKVKAKVIAALAAAIGGAIGVSGGPIGIIIGTAVGFVVGEVFNYLKKLWGDEIFKPVTLSTVVPSLTSRWSGKEDSPERTVTYSGYGGKYQVVYDWRMFA